MQNKHSEIQLEMNKIVGEFVHKMCFWGDCFHKNIVSVEYHVSRCIACRRENRKQEKKQEKIANKKENKKKSICSLEIEWKRTIKQ